MSGRRLNLPTSDSPAAPPAPPTFAPAPPTFTPNLSPPPTFTPPATTAAPAPAPRPVPPMTLDAIGQVGEQAQNQLAQMTSGIAQEAKLSDIDEMGKLLGDTLMAAKGYDPKNLFKKGFLGWFKAKATQIRMNFDSVDGVVNKLVAEVEAKAQKQRQRAQQLEQMRLLNEQHAEALRPQFEHLYKVAEWMEQNLPAVIPGDMESAQYLADWHKVIAFARKRADDLERAKEFAHQQSAIMGEMRSNAINLAQTLSDLKVTTIPALKQTFVLYIINMEQSKTADFADATHSLTQETIKRNAEQLGKNTEKITRALNRSNIDLSTLQTNYQAVINSIERARAITAEEANRRRNELPQVQKLGQDLTAQLAKPAQ